MNINELTNRQAMGLSNHYVPSVKDNCQLLFDKLRVLSKKHLLNIVENKAYQLLERYVAGQILAVIGDTRVQVLNPNMLDISTAEVEIGINKEEINQVLTDFPNIGLKREWILKETPQFVTKIEAFRVSKYLVTNQEFKIFLQETKFEELPSSWEFGIYPECKGNHPVFTITFDAAQEYVNWLSDKIGRNFRLLKEVEWEYVASGNKHQEFPWGNTYSSRFANTLESGFFSSTPVGIFVEGNSKFGITDVAGNVEEYVSDDYAPYKDSPYIDDDIAISLGKYKVCRGGGFTRYADLARCSRRHGAYPKSLYAIGFRIAEDV